MATECTVTESGWQGEGTTQNQRYLSELDPGNIELMGYGVEEWMDFACKFARKVNFFGDQDAGMPDGTWEPFFRQAGEIKTIAAGYGEGSLDPHLTLFVCFLKLMETSRSHFNTLTKKHLDFYYKEVLQLKKRPPAPDSVYAVFELAKAAAEHRLEKATLLNGGKDASGKTRNYSLTGETVLNKARVADLKNICLDDSGWYYSDVADSGDGAGGKFPGEVKSWEPFGSNIRKAARYGFCLGAPSLKLSEGARSITVNINFDDNLPANNISCTLSECFRIELSGRKGWFPATMDGSTAVWKGNLFAFTITLDETADAIVPYDSARHGAGCATTNPLLRIFFNDGPSYQADSYKVYKILKKITIQSVAITTSATYAKNIVVKNDAGEVNLKSPFFPFGPTAPKNARMTIGSGEWVGKAITCAEVSINWKDRPASLKDHYKVYTKEMINKGQYVTPSEDAAVVTDDDYFLVNTGFIGKNRVTFPESPDNPFGIIFVPVDYGESLFKSPAVFDSFLNDTSSYVPRITDDYLLEMSLVHGFLHDEYSRVLTCCVIGNGALPNKPYAPLAENLLVKIDTEEITSAVSQQVELFHLHPFGTTINTFSTASSFLVPVYPLGGELYIGLADAEEKRNVSLLIQLLEGTENPETISVAGSPKTDWHYLDQNRWQPLKPDFLLQDDTAGFLQSGLVIVTIPGKLDAGQTLLPCDKFWIRASLKEMPVDSVCRFLGIHAQAAIAGFDNRGNSLEHLANGIPADTISKLQSRSSDIKKTGQPYASFGGSPEESDPDFYRRVSERLRHKQRAVTRFDYEHILLQQFNYLYRVRCLNHTTTESGFAPGEVLLVAIPDIRSQNVFDVFKPMVSQARINAIQDYVNGLNTLHVNARVISPTYEEVKVSVKVSFYKGYDVSFYTKQLQNDIARYLAPWAYDHDTAIEFNNTCYESKFIFYIEKLPYVDYLTDFTMTHYGPDGKTPLPFRKQIEPSGQQGILTSVSPLKHEVKPITQPLCKA
ncbi:MAG: baseplate J/gp47 family protein [Bacteroidota bacterium]